MTIFMQLHDLMNNWARRYNIHRYYNWAEKLMLCRNCASQTKPAIYTVANQYDGVLQRLNRYFSLVYRYFHWILQLSRAFCEQELGIIASFHIMFSLLINLRPHIHPYVCKQMFHSHHTQIPLYKMEILKRNLSVNSQLYEICW